MPKFLEHDHKVSTASLASLLSLPSNSSNSSERGTYSSALKRKSSVGDQNAEGNQTISSKPKTEKKPTKLQYQCGDKVKYYDTTDDEVVQATIIKKSGANAYQLGSKGKKIFLNIKDIIPN